MHGHSFIADVAAVLAVAGVTGALARRFNQPSIVAYLLAGFVVGPYIPIPLFADAERVEALAEFGVVLVMFAVGLEFSIAKLLKVLPVSGLTGLVQVGFLAWCGFSTGALLGFDAVSSTFLAGAVAISSTMVVTKTFAEHPPPEAVRSHVLGILVIQDVLAIVIIAVLTGVAAGEGLAAGPLLLVFTKLLAVLALLLGVGLAVVPRAVRWLGGFGSSELMVVSVIGLCFALGHIAELLGYSVALGAFVAGILVAESGDAEPIEHQVAPLRDVFAAVFFVSVGMSFDPGTALTWVPAGVLLAAVVIAGHLFAVTLGGVLTGGGLRRSVASALALGQIGELAFIIAGVGISAGAVPRHLQPILLIVALITSFTTPIAIRHSEDVARWLDHRLPGSVHRLLGLYEQWFARLQKRTGPAQAEPRSRLLRALRLVAVDAGVAVVLVVFGLSWFDETRATLAGALGWSEELAGALLGLVGLAAVLPFVYGLARYTLVLSADVADTLGAKTSSAYPRARRLIRSTVHVLITLGVGLPAVAILRPFLPGPVALPIVLALAAGFLLALVRDARGLEPTFRSSAERIAQELTRRPPPRVPLSPPASRPDATADVGSAEAGKLPFPGFEALRMWTVPADAKAAGQTLAELDLRAATGVSVLTIQGEGEIITLPHGEVRIEAGQVLGLWGAPSAVEAAIALASAPQPIAHPTVPDRPGQL